MKMDWICLESIFLCWFFVILTIRLASKSCVRACVRVCACVCVCACFCVVSSGQLISFCEYVFVVFLWWCPIPETKCAQVTIPFDLDLEIRFIPSDGNAGKSKMNILKPSEYCEAWIHPKNLEMCTEQKTAKYALRNTFTVRSVLKPFRRSCAEFTSTINLCIFNS